MSLRTSLLKVNIFRSSYPRRSAICSERRFETSGCGLFGSEMESADGYPDWPQEDTEEAAQGAGNTQHLWEESWDDDDTNEDFSKVLK